ncbi:MAG: flavohemoglobin expression-modulating QEGLA motif protein [Anaerolineae bacterium]|nr:flavohemoglobin expression-modulating QEGLA motif protein [Anaerolineae bacterium]
MTESISADLIDKICSQLSQGRRIKHSLPLEGRLQIDRPLPFLCVYRRPVKRQDPGTERLVTGESSQLIASGDPQLKPGLSLLVKRITEILAEKYSAFLILEIWSAPEHLPVADLETAIPRPTFRIISSKVRPPTVTIEALEHALKGIKILKQSARVELVFNQKRSPPGLSPLLPASEARRLNCFVLGLEIQPIYHNRANDEIFPVILRNMHRGLARALKQAFFEFSQQQTIFRPASSEALGRRALVKAVWDVDRRLAEISNAIYFLLQVTPVNISQAKARFKQLRYERMPTLYYRPLPVDPALLKRKLYQIPLERIEDPTLALLFRQKRAELDRQLSMLSDRGTSRFLFGSLQLFGGVSDELKQLALSLLSAIPPRSREKSTGESLDAVAFAKQARAEIDYYRLSYPQISATVQIRDDIVGLMVSAGNLLVGKETKISRSRVEALLQHEVGTHVLTYFNGQAQPFQQLYTGLAGYEELQEGLAVLTEYLVGGLSAPRLRLLAGRVIAASCLIDGATFVETYRELHQTYGFSRHTSFTITVRIFRGGGFTKDAVYLRGLVGVLNYVQKGGSLEPLFVGKIAANHIPIIQELQSRQVLRPAPLRPRYMDYPQTAERLARIKNGVTVLNLIERK